MANVGSIGGGILQSHRAREARRSPRSNPDIVSAPPPPPSALAAPVRRIGSRGPSTLLGSSRKWVATRRPLSGSDDPNVSVCLVTHAQAGSRFWVGQAWTGTYRLSLACFSSSMKVKPYSAVDSAVSIDPSIPCGPACDGLVSRSGRRHEMAVRVKEGEDDVIVVVVVVVVVVGRASIGLRTNVKRPGRGRQAPIDCASSSSRVLASSRPGRVPARQAGPDGRGRGGEMSSYAPVTSFASSHAHPGPERLAAMRPTSSASRSSPSHTITVPRRQTKPRLDEMSQCSTGPGFERAGERTRQGPTRADPGAIHSRSEAGGCATRDWINARPGRNPANLQHYSTIKPSNGHRVSTVSGGGGGLRSRRFPDPIRTWASLTICGAVALCNTALPRPGWCHVT